MIQTVERWISASPDKEKVMPYEFAASYFIQQFNWEKAKHYAWEESKIAAEKITYDRLAIAYANLYARLIESKLQLNELEGIPELFEKTMPLYHCPDCKALSTLKYYTERQNTIRARYYLAINDLENAAHYVDNMVDRLPEASIASYRYNALAKDTSKAFVFLERAQQQTLLAVKKQNEIDRMTSENVQVMLTAEAEMQRCAENWRQKGFNVKP